MDTVSINYFHRRQAPLDQVLLSNDSIGGGVQVVKFKEIPYAALTEKAEGFKEPLHEEVRQYRILRL